MKQSINLVFTFLVMLLTLNVNSQVTNPQPPGGAPANLPSKVGDILKGKKTPTGVNIPSKVLTIPGKPQIENPNGGNVKDKEESINKAPKKDDDEVYGKGVSIRVDSIGIYGHDYLRTNNFDFYKTVKEVNVDKNYRLGVGDKLIISVWSDEDIKNDNFTIAEDGSIELPTSILEETKGFGRIYLANVTLGKARKILKSQYKKYYRFNDEDFDVTLTAARNINVDIVGEVVVPGSYRIPAINTVYNVIKKSGGPTANGTVRKIQIKRDGQIIQTLDVYKYLNEASNKQNIYLEDNDVIYVPKIGKVVEVDGAVKKETRFELLPNEDFYDLLNYAGGFRTEAFKNSVQVFRYDNNRFIVKDLEIDLNNPKRNEAKLVDGDVITVKDIPNEINNIVTSEGALNQEGFYEFFAGMRVSDLIQKSDGLRFDAILTRAYITRVNDKLQIVNVPIDLETVVNDKTSEANVKLKPQDKLLVLSKSDFYEDFSVEIFGQIKRPGRYVFGTDLTLQDLLVKAGGFKANALTSEIELRRVVEFSEVEGRQVPVKSKVEKFKLDYDFLDPDNLVSSLELKPYDQIFVRTIPEFDVPKTITVTGEVKYPGAYPILNKKMRISDLIEDAGGLTEYSYIEGAKFYRLQDSVYYDVDTLLNKSKVDKKLELKFDTVRKTMRVSRLFVLDLPEIERRPSSDYNYVLKAGDRLEIPTIDKTISIDGAVNKMTLNSRKVNTAYRGSKNAKWYINEFGAGYDKDAWRRTTQVVYPNGQVKGTKKFLFFNIYPEVQPGTDIYVEERPEKKKKEGVGFFGGLNAEKTIALITSATTTMALILAVSNR